MSNSIAKNNSFISQILSDKKSAVISSLLMRKVFFVVLGTVLLSVLAQVRIPLPFTPVPVTGQTFGVALIALTWGALAPWTVAAYLLAGFAGLPVFANAAAGLVMGPTIGYLGGMLLASLVVGQLVERGALKGFWSALMLAYLSSSCVFAIGLPVLASFVGTKAVLVAGLYPFLIGDLLKNLSAAAIASRLKR